jgi:hypothetical protein
VTIVAFLRRVLTIVRRRRAPVVMIPFDDLFQEDDAGERLTRNTGTYADMQACREYLRTNGFR